MLILSHACKIQDTSGWNAVGLYNNSPVDLRIKRMAVDSPDRFLSSIYFCQGDIKGTPFNGIHNTVIGGPIPGVSIYEPILPDNSYVLRYGCNWSLSDPIQAEDEVVIPPGYSLVVRFKGYDVLSPVVVSIHYNVV